MKTKFTLILMFALISSIFAQTQVPDVVYAQFGPPAEANVWEHYIIPLTHESFGVDSITFDEVLSQVSSIWFRTEMHSGPDTAGLDIVKIGATYYSDFNGSSEYWSSGGDGTMEWYSTGGYEGGYVEIADWATGIWSYLIAPASWAGDWTALRGQNIDFWYKTDQPSYNGEIEIRTGEIKRLVINTPYFNTILPDDSVYIEIEILPAPTEEITISFSSSNTGCITVPGPITISTGTSAAYLYFNAAEGATVGCESVIEATSSGYITSRITMRVLDNYGVQEDDLQDAVSVFPNPCSGRFTLENTSGAKINRLVIYGLTGNIVLDMEQEDISNTQIDITGQSPGIYFLRVMSEDKVLTSKIIVE